MIVEKCVVIMMNVIAGILIRMMIILVATIYIGIGNIVIVIIIGRSDSIVANDNGEWGGSHDKGASVGFGTKIGTGTTGHINPVNSIIVIIGGGGGGSSSSSASSGQDAKIIRDYCWFLLLLLLLLRWWFQSGGCCCWRWRWWMLWYSYLYPVGYHS